MLYISILSQFYKGLKEEGFLGHMIFFSLLQSFEPFKV